jgi:hypothetical protein
MENPHADFAGGTRHSTEVDYHMFRDDLKRELRQAGIDIGKPPARTGKPRPAAVGG